MSFLRGLRSQPLRPRPVTSLPTSRRTFRTTQSVLRTDPTKPKATPELYLKDEGIPGVSSGATESEGSGAEESGSGQKYVVSGVLPSESHYGVPGGAFRSGDPLEPQQEAKAPGKGEPSSTSADYAHPVTTKKASRLDEGAGSSSALRTRDAKGEMGKGSYGGEELSKGNKATENRLDERNTAPTPEMGRQGIDEAWKHRK